MQVLEFVVVGVNREVLPLEHVVNIDEHWIQRQLGAVLAAYDIQNLVRGPLAVARLEKSLRPERMQSPPVHVVMVGPYYLLWALGLVAQDNLPLNNTASQLKRERLILPVAYEHRVRRAHHSHVEVARVFSAKLHRVAALGRGSSVPSVELAQNVAVHDGVLSAVVFEVLPALAHTLEVVGLHARAYLQMQVCVLKVHSGGVKDGFVGRGADDLDRELFAVY